MFIAMKEADQALPFALNIQGTRWGNLFQTPGIFELKPFVRPDTVSLETSVDESGGSLSFEVEQMVTPAVISIDENYYGEETGAWWNEANLPDNAIVEFRANAAANPGGAVQPRLFVGFIDSIETRPTPSGQGTISLVTCVSSNSLLDRIVLRKPLAGKAAQRRGQTTGRITIKRGTDRYQIRQILKYAGAKRTYGNLDLFDPRKSTHIFETSTKLLPKLELSVGTLREAIETVAEAAQELDGRRRAFHINQITGGLFYGRAEASVSPKSLAMNTMLTGPTDWYDSSLVQYTGAVPAPFNIVDNPADQSIEGADAIGAPDSAIFGRDLTVSIDHSRVSKVAVFLGADSKSDRDTDPDPYVRKYDSIELPDGKYRATYEWIPGAVAPQPIARTGITKQAFDRRAGMRFESVVEASTIRSGTITQRSAQITRLARGYFGYRRTPEMGATVSIRGAADTSGHEYGFAAGWRDGVFYGWAPGQTITITNKALGFKPTEDVRWVNDLQESNGEFRIIAISMSFEPGSFIRRFDLTLGRRPRSTIASLVAAE